MKLASIGAIIVGLAGCSAPAPRAAPGPTATRPFEWSEVMDAVWDAVAKHNQVWVDEIQLTGGRMMDQKLKALDPDTTITGSKHGMLLKCHARGTDVKAMTAFRRELKDHPILSRHFPIVNFDVSWRVVEMEIAEKFSLEFEVILVNPG